MDRKNLSGKDLLLASAVLSRYRWQFKKQINTISLDALLNYVYNKYQEDTTASSTSVLNRMKDSFESGFHKSLPNGCCVFCGYCLRSLRKVNDYWRYKVENSARSVRKELRIYGYGFVGGI